MRTPKPLSLAATGALLVACNAIVGVGSDYHLAPGTAGSGPTGGKGGASASGGASTGGKGASGGAAGKAGNAGSSMTSGGTSGGDAGGGRGGTAGNSTSSGGDSGSPGGDGGEAGFVGSGGSGGDAGKGGNGTGGGSGSGGKGGSGGNAASSGTGGSAGTGGSGGSAGTGGSKGGTGGAGGKGGSGGASGSGGSAGSGSTTDVQVRLANARQTIQGFGISTNMMPGSETVPVDVLFDTAGVNGLGLSILRVGMNSNGSLAGKYVTEAKAKGAKVIGTVRTAPANCKTNGRTDQGGALLDTCYESWGNTIANFAMAQGLYAMSVQSQPDFASCAAVGPPCTDDYDTMTFTGTQMAAWVKVVGPKLKAVGVKVIAPEVAEWNHAWSNASATGSLATSHPHSSDPLGCGCFSNTLSETGCDSDCLAGDGYDYGHWLWADSVAWGAFDILGVQQYDSQRAYAWPADVNGGVKNKEVWQTEMSGIRYWPEEGPSIDIDNGIAVAGWIHSALTVGEASAWLWSWYDAYYANDNEGLALVQGNSTIAKRYYALGNYSKFVRPSYLAVEVFGNDDPNVLLSAYKSPASTTVVVVAVNKASALASPTIGFTGGTAPTSCLPTITSATQNLANGSPVAVAGGVLTTSLAGKTVTTYVCN